MITDIQNRMYRVTRILVNKGALKRQQFIRNTSIRCINKSEDQIKAWYEIPGPLSLPVIGQLLHFLPGGWLYKRPMELQELLYKNYGPIVRLDGNWGFDPIIFLYDPEAAINLFRNEDPLPNRPGFDSIMYYRKKYYNESDDDPSGLIIDNGECWKKMRHSVNPVMLHIKTIKQYANIMAEVAEDMIKKIKQLRNNKNQLEGNIFTELNLWALESVGVVALGRRLNCFDPNLPNESPVKKLINVIHDVLNATEKLDFQPSIWKYIATPDFKKGMKIYEEHLKLNEFFIDKAIEQFRLKEGSNNKDKSILEKLLEIDRKVAVAMANDMMFAGVDTTAATVLGLLYLLAINKKKQSKLRKEVLSQQEKRPYLKACIKESLRLFPILSGNFRRTTKDHDILGYRIPKNMNVVIGNQHLCMMEEEFPRPTEFIPERWIVDRCHPLHYRNAHPFSYTPFGFGVRSCIGRRIAELELETFIGKIMENFEIEWFGPSPKRTRASTLNFFLGPYNFIFKDIESGNLPDSDKL
ncbi:cytochrome P450 CYP12A2-like isoform X1 [Pararge aegeria]|uniref:cytochrome P450 CYP12A2-like isoform X1 n=1 Tax=Pararge aegeria TaxID=116150 RepID=UPI0019CF5C97|nr:cytochrome P450 CYP12A2-like isoform X1 [Pararge aegeria]